MKVFLLFFASLLFLSCSNDDALNLSQPITENDVLGRWEVTQVVQSPAETTTNLNGYVFEFKTNNDLVITNEESLIEGKWSVMIGNQGLKLLIPIKEEPLRMFHNEWSINSLSSNSISLSAFSNEADGNIEHINFEKL